MHELPSVKRTREDDIYAEQFGEQLAKVYLAAKSNGTTDHVFAESIGVERAQLRKYLRGEAVPNVTTCGSCLATVQNLCSV